MRSEHRVHLLAAVLLLLSLLPLTAAAQVPAGSAQPATIDPALLDRIAEDGTASFFVQMSARADLSAAYGLDWQARGEYVWNALRLVAQNSQAPVLAYARQYGLDVHSLATDNSVYIRAGTLQAVRDLIALPGVAGIRLERTFSLPETAPSTGTQLPAAVPEAEVSWALGDVHALDLWGLGVRGAGAKVAGIDTGVQWDHPALIGQYGCPDDPGNEACWYDPSNICGGVPCDNNGHGTYMMGLVAADDDPDLAHTVGVAPDVTWIACKGCESAGCSEFALVSCAQWSLAPGGNPANRPQVVNNPWGGLGCDDWFLPEVDAWLAAGIAPAFPAGAQGPACATIGSPADYPGVLATGAYDAYRAIASFSSRGPSCFTTMAKPNLVAPGVDLCSTYPGNTWSCGWSGTSLADSYTAGAAALVISGCPDLAGDVAAIMQTLQDSADEPPEGNCGVAPSGGNYTYGHGYLNVLGAAQSCGVVPTMHVEAMVGYFSLDPLGRVVLRMLVQIADGAGIPLGDVEVTATITPPAGDPVTRTRWTRPTGYARFHWGCSACAGVWELCVEGVSRTGYVYDPADNVVTCETWQN